MKLTWKTCLKVGISLFVLYLAIHYWGAVSALLTGILGAGLPLVIGGAIAYLVNILMANYERHYFPRTAKKALIKSRRPVCLTLAFLTLIAIISLVFWIILPQLGECFSVIVGGVPGFMNKAVGIISQWGVFSPETDRKSVV